MRWLAALLLAVPLALSAQDAQHVPEPDGYWTGPTRGVVPATIRGGKVIHAAELIEMLKAGNVVVIDVDSAPKRPAGLAASAPWLPAPHPGIPGSLWIPGAGLGELPPQLDAFFRETLAAATGQDPDRTIVVYCHEQCWLSWNAARRAIDYGYRNVYWFPEGIEGWRAAGAKTAVNEPRSPR